MSRPAGDVSNRRRERRCRVGWSAWTKTAEQQQEGGTWDEAYDNGLALITNC